MDKSIDFKLSGYTVTTNGKVTQHRGIGSAIVSILAVCALLAVLFFVFSLIGAVILIGLAVAAVLTIGYGLVCVVDKLFPPKFHAKRNTKSHHKNDLEWFERQLKKRKW